MTRIERSALVPFSAAQMYELVNDVPAYKEFLPWCVAGNILEHSDSHMVASLDMSKGMLKKSFLTRNELILNKEIKFKLLEGPFKSLSGSWLFEGLGEGEACKITCILEFELEGFLAMMASKSIAEGVADKIMHHFLERARQIYPIDK